MEKILVQDLDYCYLIVADIVLNRLDLINESKQFYIFCETVQKLF